MRLGKVLHFRIISSPLYKAFVKKNCSSTLIAKTNFIHPLKPQDSYQTQTSHPDTEYCSSKACYSDSSKFQPRKSDDPKLRKETSLSVCLRTGPPMHINVTYPKAQVSISSNSWVALNYSMSLHSPSPPPPLVILLHGPKYIQVLDHS